MISRLPKMQSENVITDTAKQTADRLTLSLKPVIEKLENWIEQAWLYLPNFVIAILFLLLFIFFARLVRRFINKYVGRFVENQAAVNILSNVAYAMIFISGILFSLSILQLDGTVDRILAGVGILGVALGFAFQDTASNFISGTFMAFRKNFKVGDLILTNETLATVEEIDLRSTKLKSLDGYQVILPNKEIFQKKLINYNTYSTRRVELSCGVAYNSDLEAVQQITLDAISTVEEIKKSPSPQFFYTNFGDSSIDYVLYFWVDFLSMPDLLDAQHLAIKAIKKKYDEHGITIPFPIRTLDFSQDSKLVVPKN